MKAPDLDSVRVGIQPVSLVDYPGRVSAVAFLAGCNFRCPYCHNPDLALNRADAAGQTWAELRAHLEQRRGLLTGLVISGGEPTMTSCLPELVADARRLGYAVKLDTNGSEPERLEVLSLDYVAMDVKTALARYGELWPGAPADAAERVARSMDVIRSMGVPYEFRITCAPGIFGPADAEAVAPYFRPDDQVILQAYRSARVLDPAWAERVGPVTEARLKDLADIIRRVAPKTRVRGV